MKDEFGGSEGVSPFILHPSSFILFQMVSFPNVSGGVWRSDADQLAQGHEAARRSPRLRIILPLHRRQDAPVQRMLNFMQPGTYIRPHIHRGSGASESICLISGRLVYLIWNADGSIRSRFTAEAGTPTCVVDMEPDVWHSFLVTAPDTCIFECKKGPYSAMDDKDFAPWAPAEGSPEVAEWMRKLTVEAGI